MKPFKIVLLFAAMTVLCACPADDGHRYITVVNKSEKNIVCQLHYLPENITQKDTLYQCRVAPDGIPIDSSYIYKSGRKSDWEHDLKSSYIQFLIMDKDVFSQHYTEPCDTIRKYVPVLHRYQLKLEDLQQMNWTVVYPPE